MVKENLSIIPDSLYFVLKSDELELFKNNSFKASGLFAIALLSLFSSKVIFPFSNQLLVEIPIS